MTIVSKIASKIRDSKNLLGLAEIFPFFNRSELKLT